MITRSEREAADLEAYYRGTFSGKVFSSCCLATTEKPLKKKINKKINHVSVHSHGLSFDSMLDPQQAKSSPNMAASSRLLLGHCMLVCVCVCVDRVEV